MREASVELSDLLSYGFMQRALIAGSLIACACSVLGLFLVLRRLSLIGDGLSHVAFGSVALSMLLQAHTLLVTIPVVLLASAGIFRLTKKTHLYGDAAIGIISSCGIAGGVLIASMAGGFNIDLFSYLFGNILAVSGPEVVISCILCGIVLGTVALFLRDLFAITFDEETARTSGVRTESITTLLVLLTGLTVVLAMKVVGIMLISALLIVPAAAALQVARSFQSSILLSALFGVLSVITGIVLSFFLNLPAGATIVIVNLCVFALAASIRLLKRRT
ncbi:MAG: zinc transport system permease protein [Nitrospirae bacterium]|nr:MAG: zinc transport system permease protein [Nitrospirota bacterium]